MMRVKVLFLALTALLTSAVFAQSKVTLARPHFTNPASADALYQNHCAACHGTDMKGSLSRPECLQQAPPNLTIISSRYGTFSRLQVYEAIAGRHRTFSGQDLNDMPGWSTIFRDMYQGDQGKEKLAIVNLVSLIQAHQQQKN